MTSVHKKQRKQLEILKKELETRTAKARKSLTTSHSADWSEQAVERENDEVLMELVREGEEELEQIKRAFASMDEGKYGICISCGDDINPARLDAMPMTTQCIDCASIV